MAPKRKTPKTPPAHVQGCEWFLRCGSLRQRRIVGVYDAEQMGESDDGGKWVTVCEMHGSLVFHSTRDAAEAVASHPEEFCDDCREEVTT